MLRVQVWFIYHAVHAIQVGLALGWILTILFAAPAFPYFSVCLTPQTEP